MKYHTKHGIIRVPVKKLDAFLQRKLDRLPRVPVLQMELDFGEGFNFWWYDDEGHLNPKTPSWHDNNQEDVEDYDDDIPF
jgi:hypothetical protein